MCAPHMVTLRHAKTGAQHSADQALSTGLKSGTLREARTHRGGGGHLLRHHLQGVDHGDVAQTLGDGQGGVAILKKEREGPKGEGLNSRERHSLHRGHSSGDGRSHHRL